jgi:hypothetical protein
VQWGSTAQGAFSARRKTAGGRMSARAVKPRRKWFSFLGAGLYFGSHTFNVLSTL